MTGKSRFASHYPNGVVHPWSSKRRCTLPYEQYPNDSWISHFEEHLKQGKYSSQATWRRIAVAKRFLAYLNQRRIAVETTQPSAVNLYLQSELRIFRQRHGCAPRSMKDWRSSHTSGIHILLRLVRGQWPAAAVPSTDRDIFHRRVCEDYATWMCNVRGLAPETRFHRCSEAYRFLRWLEKRSDPESLINITTADVDAYVVFRAKSFRRTSLPEHTTNVRSFLRFINSTGRITIDLSAAVITPRRYALEGIPSSLPLEHVKAVLETTSRDRSRRGLRDYAILMLLANYGLRAGEITALRLDDIDWRREVIRICHSKTCAHSELPLLPVVGNAILEYLRKGRPETDVRQIFIVDHAPYGPFQSGSSLYWVIRARLT